jgi:hypothetical protein
MEHAAEATTNTYEQARNRRIAENRNRLAQLGLARGATADGAAAPPIAGEYCAYERLKAPYER